MQIHTPYRVRGGEDSVVEREAELLRSAGHAVDQMLVPNPASAAKAGADLALAPWNPFAAKRVRKAAEVATPDVCHVHNTWFAQSPSVIRAVHSLGVPTVMTVHNYRLSCINGLLYRNDQPCETCVGRSPWAGVKYKCYRDSTSLSLVAAATNALHRRLSTWSNSVDRFIVMTEFARRILVMQGVAETRITVKPHFVEDPGPRSVPPSASDSILFVGRLAPEKGLLTLLDAWGRVGSTGFRLVIVGDGPMAKPLERMAPASVEFLGAQPPTVVRELMLSARALVVPSTWYETFGLVVAEAYSAGLPALVSDIGALGEIGRWIPNALLTSPGSAEELRRGLLSLGNSDLVDSLGAASRRAYRDRLTPAVGLEALLMVYQTAAEAGSR